VWSRVVASTRVCYGFADSHALPAGAFYINVVAAVALAIVMIVFAVEDKKIGGGLIGPLCAACGQFWQIGVAMDLEKKAKAGVYDKPAAGTESV